MFMSGCNYNYDCLNHIMQTCSYNYNNRIHRHNYLNSLIMSIPNKHKYITYSRTTHPNSKWPT